VEVKGTSTKEKKKERESGGGHSYLRGDENHHTQPIESNLPPPSPNKRHTREKKRERETKRCTAMAEHYT